MFVKNVFVRSIELCSLACTDEPAGTCEAFSISEEGNCEFGTIEADDCLATLGQNDPGAVQVFADTNKYKRIKGQNFLTGSGFTLTSIG